MILNFFLYWRTLVRQNYNYYFKLKNIKMGLTDKQSMFIVQYLVDLNATEACIRAGYSKKTSLNMGPLLLRNPLIKKLIEDKICDADNKTGLVVENVLRDIDIVKEKAMNSEKWAQALKALELQGRYLKMYTDKSETNSSVQVRVYDCKP